MRYTTWEQAEKGHAEMVYQCRGAGFQEGQRRADDLVMVATSSSEPPDTPYDEWVEGVDALLNEIAQREGERDAETDSLS